MKKTVNTKLPNQPIYFKINDAINVPSLTMYFFFTNEMDDIPLDWDDENCYNELEIHFDIPEIVNDFVTLQEFEDESPERLKLAISLLRRQLERASIILDNFEKDLPPEEPET